MKLGARSAFWWRLVAVVGLFVLSTSDTTAQNVTELEQRVEILEVEVVNMEDDIDDIEIDVDHQDSRITIVEETVIDQTNDIADLSGSVEDTEDAMILLQGRMSTLEAANNLLQEQVGVLETTVTEQEEIIVVLENTIEDLQLADNATNDRVTELGVAQDVLESDLLETNEVLTDVESRVTGHDTELQTLGDRMLVLEDIVDDVEDGMTSLEAVNADMQQRLSSLEEAVMVPWVACASSPCSNGGTCIDVNVDTAICMCRDGYFGLTCDESYSNTAFLATFDVGTLTPTDPIVFNVAVLNDGGHYDVTSGIYTVPLDGTYEFIVHILSNSDYDIYAYLVVDDEQVTYNWAYGHSSYPYLLLESVVLMPLTAGQQVWVEPYAISSMYGAYRSGMRSWFSGHLIHAV